MLKTSTLGLAAILLSTTALHAETTGAVDFAASLVVDGDFRV